MDVVVDNLLQLHNDSLLYIFSLAANSTRELCCFSLVCSRVHSLFCHNDSWSSLLRSRFRISEERRIEDWPQISSSKHLYRILERYSHLEGYYQLESCFPWGLLAQFRFCNGVFVGEVFSITATEQVLVRFISVHFIEKEKRNKSKRKRKNESWVEKTVLFDVEGSKKAFSIKEIECTKTISSSLLIPGWDKEVPFMTPSLTIRIYASTAEREKFLPESNDLRALWAALPGMRSHEKVPEMLKQLLANNGGRLVLSRVDGATSVRALDPGFFSSCSESLNLKQGLYTGLYHPDLYGQHSSEVLLLTYRKFDFTSKESITDFATEIYRKEPTMEVEQLVSSACQDLPPEVKKNIVFFVGRKVCGDVNVPMGAVSFFALVQPKYKMSEIPKFCDATIKGKKTRVEILTAWPGQGTLSFLHFQHPSWSTCALVQCVKAFQDEREPNSPIMYGVWWDKWRHNDITVLTWMEEQDHFPFLEQQDG